MDAAAGFIGGYLGCGLNCFGAIKLRLSFGGSASA
jgi:hypothetical protein